MPNVYTNAWTDESDHLACPVCGGDHMHHTIVNVYYRDKEDATSHRTMVNGSSVLQTRDLFNENPSRRRDGVKIRFWCEGCGRHPQLLISQHKGQTEVQWVYDTEEKGTDEP